MEELELKGFGFIAGTWPFDPGRASLVFIHGAGGGARLWTAQVTGLSGRANTAALYLPGHGPSAGPARDSIKAYAESVLDFIDKTGVPNPVAVGLSMGGAITLQLLLDFPDRFRAGILVSTGAKLRVMPQIFDAIERDYSGFLEMIERFSISKKTDPSLVRAVLEDAARCDPAVASGDFRACDSFSVMDLLGEISVPVLVITAEDDLLTPPKYGEYLERGISGASRVHVMDGGHMVSAEKPEEVNRAIIEFFDRLGL